jgi:predicted branched-subunit amino acid permease
MFFLPEYYRHPEFRVGARAMWPQAPGIAAWGLMTGVAMVKSGMSVTESLLMALFVYAGSAQLASIPLIVAGAPAWVILSTGMCVNLRFVVFSLHLRPYLMHLPLWQRLTQGYLTADLSYVLFTQRFAKPASEAAQRRAQETYLAGNCCVNWCSWVSASLAGVALANFIPTRWGLGFAGILCLVGILCSLASTRLRVMSAVVAGVTAVVAYHLPLKLNIVLSIGVAVLLCLLLDRSPSQSTRAVAS